MNEKYVGNKLYRRSQSPKLKTAAIAFTTALLSPLLLTLGLKAETSINTTPQPQTDSLTDNLLYLDLQTSDETELSNTESSVYSLENINTKNSEVITKNDRQPEIFTPENTATVNNLTATSVPETVINDLQLSSSPLIPPPSNQNTVVAQVSPPTIITPPPTPTLPTTPIPRPLPPPAELLQPSSPSPTSPETPSGNIPGLIEVKRFDFIGNTAFSSDRLREELRDFINKPLTFTDLLTARSVITDFYVKNGYQTSGALIPPQKLEAGIVTIQIVEGGLEDIKVNGLQRLNPNYVRSRIAIAGTKPLNVPRLLETLRLLQLDPLIGNVSAELSAGSQPGSSLLTVDVREANTFSTQSVFNNSRSPSIGSFRRGVQVREANLLGLGDGLSLNYGNTDGSNSYDFGYTLPINPRNGTISLSYGNTGSRVIEAPFDVLDIRASSRYFDITLRQPLIQTPSQEFAIGLTGSRRESDTSLLNIPFPLSAGANDLGQTRVTAIRFFQEFTQRETVQVFAARSQFSFGIGAFNSTINQASPDSQFVAWRGQAQLVRLLAPDTLFLIRGDVQIADRTLLPIEQYGIGGLESVRGYRQDLLLTDNGALFSAEVRIPVLRLAQSRTLLQVVPFLDVGTAWNSSNREAPNPPTLVSIGVGLNLVLGDRLTARLDYGIPLTPVNSTKRNLQENGIYFSVFFNPF